MKEGKTYQVEASVVGSPHIRDKFICSSKFAVKAMIEAFKKEHGHRNVIFRIQPYEDYYDDNRVEG